MTGSFYRQQGVWVGSAAGLGVFTLVIMRMFRPVMSDVIINFSKKLHTRKNVFLKQSKFM
jgi:hypothetical protein